MNVYTSGPLIAGRLWKGDRLITRLILSATQEARIHFFMHLTACSSVIVPMCLMLCVRSPESAYFLGYFKSPPYVTPSAFSVGVMHIFIHGRPYIWGMLTTTANSPSEIWLLWSTLRRRVLWRAGICLILNDQHPDLASKSCLGWAFLLPGLVGRVWHHPPLLCVCMIWTCACVCVCVFRGWCHGRLITSEAWRRLGRTASDLGTQPSRPALKMKICVNPTPNPPPPPKKQEVTSICSVESDH